MKKYKLGIIGSGALASIIGQIVYRDLSEEFDILGILSRNIDNAISLSNKLGSKAYKSLDEMIEDKPDYIIEAASPEVLKNMGIKILKNSINLIPLSVGGLANKEFYKQIEKTARENNSRVHIPSGAVGGFDVLRGASLMEEVQVSITTEKAPHSLNGAPALKDRKLSEESMEEVFQGSALEAIKLFPKNINVAVATALATNGVDKTKVIIKSIPGTNTNKHHIKLKGQTIKVDLIIEGRPSEKNPKSSELTAYSVIALLKNLVDPIVF